MRKLYTSSIVRQFLLTLTGLTFASVCLADGRVRIEVTDADSSRPISEAGALIISRDGKETKKAADAKGRVIVEGLAPGLYEIRVNHPNYYISRMPSVRIIDGKTTPVDVKLSQLRGLQEEVIVIASATYQDSLSSVGTSERDREALRSAAGGGGDVLRSLDGLPGLFSDGEFSSFTVRGNGPRDNLILVDGIPFSNVVHFSDAFGDQSDIEGGGRYSVFAPNIISGVKFQPGGWGPEYGGLAGSLLELEVAEGNIDTSSYSARLDISGLEIGYDGPSYIREDTSILFSARSLDFTRLFEAVGVEDLGEPRLTDTIFKTTSQISEDDKVNFLALVTTEDFDREVEHAINSDEHGTGNFEDVQLADASRENAFFVLSWEHFLSNDARIDQKIYSRNYDESVSWGEAYPDLVPVGTPVRDVPVRNDILESTREEQELGYRLDLEWPNALGVFSSGLRVTQYDLDYELTLNEEWDRFTYDASDFRPDPEQRYVVLTPELVNNQYAQSETNYALYANHTFEFDGWDFRAGLRYDRDNFSDEDVLSPRLGVSWLISNNLRFTATAGRYHQAPTFIDRASDSENTELQNEIIDQFSLGFAYAFSEKLELRVEPYYQHLTELIVEQDGVAQTLANTGEGRAWGVDTVLSRSFYEGWSADFSYSYNNSRVKDHEGADYYDADFNRPHSVTAGSIWEVNDTWKLSLRWKYASGKPLDEYVVHEDVLGGDQPLRYSRETVANNTDRYDAYSSCNFRVDYRRSFGRTHVVAFLDVLNVFGSENQNNSYFNERNGEEVVDEGEALPIFGLLLEW